MDFIKEKEKTYRVFKEKYQKLLKKNKKTAARLSVMRLLLFISTAIITYFLAAAGNLLVVTIFLISAAVAFLVMVKVHSVVLEKGKLYEAFVRVNDDEINALRGDFSGFKTGDEYNVDSHPYANDIDIFGRNSLFGFLDRSATYLGYEKLAYLLSHPGLDSEALKRRQEAVSFLKDKIRWRQLFRATGLMMEDDGSGKQRIIGWVNQQPLFDKPLYAFFTLPVPVISVLMVFLLISNFISAGIFISWLIIPWSISGMVSGRTNKRHNMVGKTAEILKNYSALLREIETLETNTVFINTLKNKLFKNGASSSGEIKKLSSIVNFLDQRLNIITWAFLNGFFLWDILMMRRLEKWQSRNKENLKNWFEVIAEVDALCSLANYYFNNDDYVFPEITDGDFMVKASDTGHPLIDRKNLVKNDLTVKKGEFIIITGANMAGKSTYLRTAGVNLVLAMAGAPVCASRFQFKPVKLFTSIRTSDSLAGNESYFYAELKRLKRIIDLLKSGEELFVILDEILKGTNSKDKHSGSEALLRQLTGLGATGIIATHDVALGNLQELFPEKIKNFRFEVEIAGNKLHFDYKLRPGISRNMNATILMRQMGITI